MKRVCVFLYLPFLFYCSCRENKNDNGQSPGKNDASKFFQIVSYIQTEIAEVNKTPYFIYKINITNGKRDSCAINTAAFNQVAAQFLKPDINDEKLKKQYIESVFHDRTTKSFTLSYTTRNKQLEIQNIEVLLQEDGETVKRLFIRKFFNCADSSAIEQLSWKSGERFQINRSVQKPYNKEYSYQTDIVWNAKS